MNKGRKFRSQRQSYISSIGYLVLPSPYFFQHIILQKGIQVSNVVISMN